MLTTLNIGLAVEGHRDNDPQEVVGRLRQLFPYDLRGYRVDMSNTEATLVARLAIDPADGGDTSYDFAGRIYKLACLLGQDCIAVKFSHVPGGDLIGPGAKSWGRFDPRFFIDY